MESHEQRADELQEDADRIQEPSDDLKKDIADTRDDWDQKTKAEGVPGAMELPDEEEEEQPNEFDLEERAPETADAQGPSGVDSDDDSGDEES